MNICGFEIGVDQPFFLIAGPCVIESEDLALETAGRLQEITAELSIPFIYKSSFDKANRSSHSSFRGLGMDKGLRILDTVKSRFDLPLLTDVHEGHASGGSFNGRGCAADPGVSVPADQFHPESCTAGSADKH